jgi:hypothetical protein
MFVIRSRIMEMPEFLRFTAVPLRAQHNGFCPKQQVRFIVALARGAGVGEAARAIGMSRQTLYRIRDRPDAASFAAAWDEAISFARRAAAAGRVAGPGFSGIETLLVPRHYRGRLIGFVQREDVAGAMRLLGRLDRLAEKLAGDADLRSVSENFEDYLAALGSRSDRSDGNRL